MGITCFSFQEVSDSKEKVTRRKLRREDKTLLVPFKWFVFNVVLPDLGGRWSGKYFKRGNILHISDYCYIAFIGNTADGRVYCNYRQSTYSFFNGGF